MTIRHLSAFGSSLALHLLAAAGVLWLTSGVPQRVAGGEKDERVDVMAAFVVPPVSASTLPGLKPMDPVQDESMLQRADDSATSLSGPGFTFDFRKIADRASLLFPFLTPGLSFEQLTLAPRRVPRHGLPNPLAPARADFARASRRPPLVLGDAALQSLIDKSWSRRDRWSAFQRIARLADTYSSDAGKLPAVLRAYVEQNGLQPYVDTTIPDPRVWTQLGLAADHVEFIGFISRYASDHPSARTTTELFFLLDKLALASFDAMVALLSVEPAEDLRWTRDANADAYRFIAALRRHYDAHLQRRHLESREALRAHYDAIRLTILAGILRTTPQRYRASDARFLIGEIYWKQGRRADAVRLWADMTINPEDRYVVACTDLLAAIQGPANRDGQNLDARRIDRILDSEHGRWLSFSFDRLRQFGYRFDTF